MQKDVTVYRGLDNQDLKQINMDPWDIPFPLRNPKVRHIMGLISGMEPGEMVKGYEGSREEAKNLQSAVWRLIKRYEVDARVVLKGKEVFLQRNGE